MAPLTELSRIRSGTAFWERVGHQPTGKYPSQGKDVGTDGTLILADMARISDVPGRGIPDVLSAGEVVLQTRGMSYRAAIVPQTDNPMIAAGSLFVLSVDPDRVASAYLVSILNLPATQAALRQAATGSTILNLRRSAVEQLQVPVPTLSDQRALSELGGLVRRHEELTGRLNLLRLRQLHALTIECAKKAGDVPAPL